MLDEDLRLRLRRLAGELPAVEPPVRELVRRARGARRGRYAGGALATVVLAAGVIVPLALLSRVHPRVVPIGGAVRGVREVHLGTREPASALIPAGWSSGQVEAADGRTFAASTNAEAISNLTPSSSLLSPPPTQVSHLTPSDAAVEVQVQYFPRGAYLPYFPPVPRVLDPYSFAPGRTLFGTDVFTLAVFGRDDGLYSVSYWVGPKASEARRAQALFIIRSLRLPAVRDWPALPFTAPAGSGWAFGQVPPGLGPTVSRAPAIAVAEQRSRPTPGARVIAAVVEFTDESRSVGGRLVSLDRLAWVVAYEGRQVLCPPTGASCAPATEYLVIDANTGRLIEVREASTSANGSPPPVPGSIPGATPSPRCLSSDRPGLISCRQALARAFAADRSYRHAGGVTARLTHYGSPSVLAWVVTYEDVPTSVYGPGPYACLMGTAHLFFDARSGGLLVEGSVASGSTPCPTP